jgi:hypothetical protein
MIYLSDMKIDSKDLVQADINDFVAGGTFYRKDSEGEYSKCTIPTATQFERYTPIEKMMYRELTKKFHAEGRLFVNRNKPFENFL